MNKRKTTSKLSRFALILAGNFFVALGILGIFLPLLPTTPFLLLASACYFRSSERLYYWLMNNKWIGNYIKSYREKNMLPLKIKVLSLSFLWLTIGYSAFFVVNIFLLRVILILIAIGVTIHILSIRTLKQWSMIGSSSIKEDKKKSVGSNQKPGSNKQRKDRNFLFGLESNPEQSIQAMISFWYSCISPCVI